ncbi:hypothetical protein CTEN210_02904 [Chaetoceros tenuissimus]|uniref:RING-type domain-containing protein n=1 Tax=Chaetoceros tenuissimus TaxID=426638 RepID=A0AAD3H116_9STRA|nr:hypothetical protein CTEN210_02904 [Chaetoceros tenuissimus]
MSEQQISSNQGEESSQTIHDADTLISTSLSTSNATSNEDLENDADEVVKVESEDDSDSEELEWVQETSEFLLEACQNREWQTFEKFLSDESISKRKKKLVLEEEKECRNLALRRGAPLDVIKYLVQIEGADMISKGDCSWLHLALMYHSTTFEIVKLLVDIGGKKLVNMQSNHPEHRKRTALHIHLGLSWADSKPVKLHRKIIELLMRVGGVELLEIEDEDGYRIVDYCLEHERNIIIKCLNSSYEARFFSVQKHVRALQSVKVTPRQIAYWIWNADFEDLNRYLDNKEVSRETKQRCFNYRDSAWNRVAFFIFCHFNGPVDIAERIIDLMGTDFLMIADNEGDTCLHEACTSFEDEDDVEFQHMLVELLLDEGGTALLSVTNNFGETALHNLVSCNRVNFDSITLMVDIGGKDFLLKENNFGRTALHLASMEEEPNKDVLLYLISKGGSDLREVLDDNGMLAEDYLSPEVKQYIDLHTKTSPDLPPLSDDLQCPICFEIMNDVHIIPTCCHRFCKKCITDAFNHNGKNCPVCRAEYSIGDVRRDPLLCKFAMLAKEKKKLLAEKDAELIKAKEELATLKRKYNEM